MMLVNVKAVQRKNIKNLFPFNWEAVFEFWLDRKAISINIVKVRAMAFDVIGIMLALIKIKPFYENNRSLWIFMNIFKQFHFMNAKFYEYIFYAKIIFQPI